LKGFELVDGQAAHQHDEISDELGHGRVLALGGGGYNRANLANAWNAVVENLL
jgi:acetoin utilization protein AcuC